ncbi:hypothetical protein H5T87_08675, partial [bacterium]|nr:hypothetical protein [bacterium]
IGEVGNSFLTLAEDNTLYISAGRKLLAVEPEGKIKWEMEFGKDAQLGCPVIKGKTLCVGIPALCVIEIP